MAFWLFNKTDGLFMDQYYFLYKEIAVYYEKSLITKFPR